MIRKTIHSGFFFALAFLFPGSILAQFVNSELLPPAPKWSGKSRALTVPDDHPWVTPFEKSGNQSSPSYKETMAWLEKMTAAAPELHMQSIGTSLEGRDVYMILATHERDFSAQAMRQSTKPLFLVHAGIHSGEIDGKDAGMMLLRDLTVRATKRHLLEKVNLLFIPILSVDGHERASATNRINQRGPTVMGWRTNGRNLNLNRDFAKIETPEVQALIAVINAYEPDLYFDVHVTDGVDYQYDITYGYTGDHGYSPASARWLAATMQPEVDRELTEMGHVPGPLIFAADSRDLSKGIFEWTAGPRFSNSYGDLRHLPTVLVENHSLKPFEQRVLGTYVLLDAVMGVLGRSGEALKKAVAEDKKRRPEKVVLAYTRSPKPPENIKFLGIKGQLTQSEISDGSYIKWSGEPETIEVPYIRIDEPSITVTRPKGYWVPSNWPEIIAKLETHGVRLERIAEPKKVAGEMLRLVDPKLKDRAFEGRVQVTAQTSVEPGEVWLPKGSAWVSTDQPLCELIVLLLEPLSPDSFFQWGYFHEILQPTEYFESYAAEPLAAEMLAQNPQLKSEYEAKVKQDEAFAKNSRARLDWFYKQSPYADKQWKLYPIVRVPR